MNLPHKRTRIFNKIFDRAQIIKLIYKDDNKDVKKVLEKSIRENPRLKMEPVKFFSDLSRTFEQGPNKKECFIVFS